MLTIRTFAVLIFLILCVTDITAAEKIDITPDMKKLAAGELQVFTHEYKVKGEGQKKRVIGIILINASPEKVWEILCDWESMGGMMDNLEYYKIKHVVSPIIKGKTGEKLIEGKLKFGLFFSVYYTVRVVFDWVNYRQEWYLVSDNEVKEYAKQSIDLKEPGTGIKSVNGFEYIEPYNNGSATVYYYAPIVEVSLPVPSFIDNKIANSSVKEYMFAIKKKAETGR